MQPTNQRLSVKSRCIYCGSTSYGKGCRFGPHGVHFHSDNTTKCSFCGSQNYGRGCKINPTSDLHVHGINFNTMMKEQINSFIEHKILLHELKKDFRDFQCYKLGIIDESGNKIKTPLTEQEINSFTPMVKTILRLKKYLGSKIDLLEAVNTLEKSVGQNLPEDIIQYKKFEEYSVKVEKILNSLYQTLDEAYGEGLPLEQIKNLLKA